MNLLAGRHWLSALVLLCLVALGLGLLVKGELFSHKRLVVFGALAVVGSAGSDESSTGETDLKGTSRTLV